MTEWILYILLLLFNVNYVGMCLSLSFSFSLYSKWKIHFNILIILFCAIVQIQSWCYWCCCIAVYSYDIYIMEWVHGGDDDDIFAFILNINIFASLLLLLSSSSSSSFFFLTTQRKKPSYYCFIIKICSNTLCWCQITEIAISLLFSTIMLEKIFPL